MKETLLYDSVPAIAGLNRVDGFEPRTMMRELGDSQNKTLYLDVLFRKLWFRLKNPNGRISKRIIKLTDQVAVVEARIYLDKGDGEENYLANAFSLRFFNADGEFGSKYLEMAETAAAGRALSDAGYGSQFADAGEEYDPVQVPAGRTSGWKHDRGNGKYRGSGFPRNSPAPSASRSAPTQAVLYDGYGCGADQVHDDAGRSDEPDDFGRLV